MSHNIDCLIIQAYILVLKHTKPIFSFWSTPIFEKHAGRRHIRAVNCNAIVYYGQVVRQLQRHEYSKWHTEALAIVLIKLDFPKKHAGGGPETKDLFGVA